ncbi:serine/threonine-protein kinase [Gemmatimonas sp.]|uniref:serine/threonine-protein kinase n=1 Tax=Gemmatimonas sp. TaxID=1962908 RepID=UPI0025B7C359|nr:serine/threonine-protein kinase [Gemmatimonas sp.]MCA2996939.1 serine/threonine protein kinase [Gemmatimonas sp.]
MNQFVARLATALATHYRVDRELGAGGMATVYLAHDLKHERDVAIKVLHPDLGAALGAERFLSEIRTTARLQHPHILPLLDSGAADGLLFYVMPYVRGETLRARLEREKQLPIADAVRIAREVAGALDTHTSRVSFTATSSPRTSCCRMAPRWSPISVLPSPCNRPAASA